MLSFVLFFFTLGNAFQGEHVGRVLKPETKRSFTFQACLQAYPPECADVVANFNIDSITNDPVLTSKNVPGIQFWAEEVSAYYCCKLRTGEMEDLKKLAFEYPQMCFNKHVKSALEFASSEDSEQNLWVEGMIDYCPNMAIAEKYRRPSHFTELYDITIESKIESSQELKDRVIHNCVQGESNGEDLVDLTILFPEYKEDDLQHVVAFWGDEITEESYIDWRAKVDFSTWLTLVTQSEYSILNGIGAKFQSPRKLKIMSGIRLSGLNKKAMEKKKKELALQGTYSIMSNNCAQQVARIAQAGIGCNIREIPFLHVESIKLVGMEVGKELTQEEIEVIQSSVDKLPEDSFWDRTLRRLLGYFTPPGRRGLCADGGASKQCDRRL